MAIGFIKHIFKKEKVTFYTAKREELLADVITHAFGFFLSFLAFCYLLYIASLKKDITIIFSFCTYGISLMSAYMASTMYHLYLYFHPNPHKSFRRILLILDHSAIFFLIAGTYTPIIIGLMDNLVGWIIFFLLWFTTIFGIVYKIFYVGKYQRFSIILYAIMGWILVLNIQYVLTVFPNELILCLLAGGICYTSGIFFLRRKKLKYHHAIWHIFVLLGSAFHFFGIIFYVV